MDNRLNRNSNNSTTHRKCVQILYTRIIRYRNTTNALEIEEKQLLYVASINPYGNNFMKGFLENQRTVKKEIKKQNIRSYVKSISQVIIMISKRALRTFFSLSSYFMLTERDNSEGR